MTLSAQPMSSIGITIPIQNSESGYFERSFDTLTQVKSNIINLLNTKPGERRMQPTFGCRLWKLVFEQNQDSLADIASNIIKEDINSWIPNVTVLDITSTLYTTEDNNVNKDNYQLKLSVIFMLNMSKQQDTVSITIST